SKGNAIAFDEAAEVLGAEVMRYIYAAQNPVHNLNFPDLNPKEDAGPRLDAEVRRKLLTLWNCYSFFITYAAADNWTWTARSADVEPGELDRWILSRLQHLIGRAHTAFQDYAIYRLMEDFERFEEEFSNW